MADEEQCVFCHIAAGKIPAKKVYEDEQVTAVLDINPAADGHVLLMPKKHVLVMPQMDDFLSAHMGMVAKQLSQSLIRALKVEGTSIFVANGAAAGQRAPHVIVHIIPRRSNDAIALQLSPIKIDQKVMEEVFDKLAPAIGKHLGKEPPVLLKKEEKGEKKEAPQEGKKQERKEAGAKGSALDDITEFLAGDK